jgi:hypothetical protein
MLLLEIPLVTTEVELTGNPAIVLVPDKEVARVEAAAATDV